MRDDIVTTLHPEGSSNNIQVTTEQRKLERPRICYRKSLLNSLIPGIVSVGISFWDMSIALVCLCMYTLARTPGITIWVIRLYQRYAPNYIRLACVFEPSCSEYMILSIQKYGFIRGVIKGIHRLQRCHLPNGGTDYP
jgi:putative membrane protein insertion efficiency factor